MIGSALIGWVLFDISGSYHSVETCDLLWTRRISRENVQPAVIVRDGITHVPSWSWRDGEDLTGSGDCQLTSHPSQVPGGASCVGTLRRSNIRWPLSAGPLHKPSSPTPNRQCHERHNIRAQIIQGPLSSLTRQLWNTLEHNQWVGPEASWGNSPQAESARPYIHPYHYARISAAHFRCRLAFGNRPSNRQECVPLHFSEDQPTLELGSRHRWPGRCSRLYAVRCHLDGLSWKKIRVVRGGTARWMETARDWYVVARWLAGEWNEQKHQPFGGQW